VSYPAFGVSSHDDVQGTVPPIALSWEQCGARKRTTRITKWREITMIDVNDRVNTITSLKARAAATVLRTAATYTNAGGIASRERGELEG